MNIAYVRVSTAEQNEARQTEALSQFSIEKWFVEKASGKNTDRPRFLEMMDYVREGDVLYIHDFSRLARSTKDLLEIVEILQKKGVVLKSNKENLDTSILVVRSDGKDILVLHRGVSHLLLLGNDLN